MTNALSLEQQAAQIAQMLHTLPPTPDSLLTVLHAASVIPLQFLSTTFVEDLAQQFNMPAETIAAALNIRSNGQGRNAPLESFDGLIPQSGWFRDYIDYTLLTEPPIVFHFFAAMTIVGATLARRIYFPRGSGDVFPNINCVLIAPAGVCKKTTACNLAVSLFRRIGGNVLADKVTPEAIVESFRGAANATGLIYAPEWSVFLGKQQYMEGLVPLLTTLFDCPATWSSSTIMRGQASLANVALSHLAATTIDWMQTSITKDAFSGGFMSRLLFIVQHNTPRSFALPPPLDARLSKRLTDGLLSMQQTVGTVTLSVDGEEWYRDWYDARKATSVVERQMAGYFERKPDRLLQIAMVLNAAQDPKRLALNADTLKHAERILSWLERLLPSTFEELSATAIGDDQHRLLKQIRNRNGEIAHSEWMRMNSNRLNAHSFSQCIDTLRQASMITYDVTKRKYYLLPAGWDT